MAVWRSVIRSIKAVAYFGGYGLQLWIKNPKSRQDRAAWINSFLSSLMKAFDVKFTVEGQFPRGGVLISNHTGYLDIVSYAALSPVVYCAKAEMEHWFFLGWMTRMVGTVFVDRGRGGSAEKAKAGMQAAEQEGVPVVFFPEGTTSDGSVVLPLRTGLLAVSLEARQPITAAFVHYTFDQDNGPGVTVENTVAFWGKDANMIQHIWHFLGSTGVHAYVRIAPAPIVWSRPDIDRKTAAIEARAAILALAPAAVQQKSAYWTGKPAVVDYEGTP